MRLQPGIEMIEDYPGFHRDGARRRIETDDLVQPFAVVDHQRLANGLSALAGTGATRKNRHVVVAGDVQRQQQIILIAGHHHTNRHDLIDRGIGCVSATIGRAEQNLAFQLLP